MKGGKREGAGRKPRGDQAMTDVTQIRSSTEWKQEIARLAEWDHAESVAELIDRAIACYARERGYPGLIPKR